MGKKYCDIAIIGAGPAGYVAAIKAAQLGKKVLLIEKDSVGGTCLNVGCIPTKAMIEAASVLSGIDNAKRFGIYVKDVNINFEELINYRERIVRQLAGGIEFLFKANKVDLIKGHGRLLSTVTIGIDNNEDVIEAKNIIVASGSKTTFFKIEGISDEKILDSTKILNLKEIPKNLLIIGAGAIGLEFGWLFKKLGSAVTVVEKMANILPTEDVEVSNRLKNILQKEGISIFTSSTVQKVEANIAKISDGKDIKEIQFDELLMAVGRTPNTDGMGLEEAGVKLSNRKEIMVDTTLKTNISNIYACGDCIGGYQLAHVAYHEAEVVIKNIFEEPCKIDYKGVPRCVYAQPEFAAVGFTEEQAKDGYDIKIGRFPFSANSRAHIFGETEGFIKMISDKKTDKILGAHIIGPFATELINEIALAIGMSLTTKDVIDSIHTHPSLSEAIKEALLNTDKKAIHIKN